MNTRREHISPTTDYPDDDFQAFFVDCFHLKDWLRNDSASGLTSQDVEDFVNNSGVLALCGDLANGSKHLVLTTPRVDPNAKLSGKLFKVSLQAGGRTRQRTTIAYSYKVEALGKTFDAFELASACIAELAIFSDIQGVDHDLSPGVPGEWPLAIPKSFIDRKRCRFGEPLFPADVVTL